MEKLNINKNDGEILYARDVVDMIKKINALIECCNKHGGTSEEESSEVTITAFEAIENIDVYTPEDPVEGVSVEINPELIYLTIRYTTSDNKSKTIRLDGSYEDLNNDSSTFA